MGDAADHLGRRRRAAAATLAAAAVLGSASASPGQRGVVAVNGDENKDANTGFMVRKQPAAVTDAIDDFERYRDHKAWEKAFAALAKVGEAAGDRLVLTPEPAGAGERVAIPAPLKVRRELLSLSPEGRQAYRVFNDAKAQQLFTKATTPPADPAAAGVDDVPLLRQVVDQYFITSVGDQAADRLGDALFEAGDPGAAEACWRLVVDEFPDSTLPAAQLQVKRAIALATAGQGEAFDAVRATVRDRYAGQTVRVAGRSVEAAAYVDGLATRAHRAGSATPASAGDGPPLAMPTSDVPVWQVPLMDGDTAKSLEARMNNYGWGWLAGQLLSAVPPVAVDGKRVYVNWYGATIAADLSTGKLAWRTASPAAVAESMVASISQGNPVQPTGYAMVLAGDRLLTVGRPPVIPDPANPNANNNNGQPVNVVLECLSTGTGKVAWTTKAGPLKAWSFVGPPLVDADAVHCVAIEVGENANGNGTAKQEYTLLTVALADGALRSKVAMGTPQFPTDNYRGNPVVRAPVLMAANGRVLVLTNDGALLSVDPRGGRLEWAFTFKPRPDAQQNWNGYAAPRTPEGPANLLRSGSTLFVKECGATQLFAVDTANGPAVRWRRPADGDAGLVALRNGDAVMVGDSADAIAVGGEHTDADLPPMRWSNLLSTGTGDARPILAGGHLYVFGRRGVHDLLLSDGTDAGPIFRGADRDADGGPLFHVPGLLVTVSARAVSAYPIADGTGPATRPLGMPSGGH